AEREQRARELRASAPCVLDRFDVFAPGILGWRGVQEELGATQDGCEEIVEVVGDAPGELPYCLHLLGLSELVLQLAAGGDVPREHQAGGAACEADRLRFDVDVDQRSVFA